MQEYITLPMSREELSRSSRQLHRRLIVYAIYIRIADQQRMARTHIRYYRQARMDQGACMSENVNYGKIHVEYPEPLIAGTLVTVTFTYTVGSSAMKEGGRLRIALPNPGWGEPLVPQHYFWDCYQKGKERRYTNYDRVNTTARVESKKRQAVPFLSKWPGFRKPFGLKKTWMRDYDRWWIELVLEDDGLDPGDRIILIYGDPDRKPLTAYVQRFPDEKIWFLAFVDPQGDNTFYEADASPWMTSVKPGPASQLQVVIPSVILADRQPEALVAYLDDVRVQPNSPVHVTDLKLSYRSGFVEDISVGKETYFYRFKPEALQKEVKERGYGRITVTDSQHGFTAQSNPALVRENSPRLFWGDLHVQSKYHGWSEEDQVGISCGSPEEIYDFAYNVNGLDFCAITDTDTLCKDVWSQLRDTALRSNRDGEFVVFQGTEIGDNVDGHRNTIFGSSNPEPGREPSPSNERPASIPAHTAQDLFRGRDDVLLIYHHTKVWNNWSRWEPTLEFLAEIYSCWGLGERAGTDLWDILAEHTGGVQEAWAKGYRLGVVAGSDTHTGTPGRRMWKAERNDMFLYPCGLTGVWAEELSRTEIFKSLKKRYCYGTTGARIVLEFFLERFPMGSEVEWESAQTPRRFCISAWGTDTIESLQIVKNNMDACTFHPKADDFSDSWTDTNEALDGDYYYVRLIQRDGHRAWSSPIWVDRNPV